MRLSNLVHGLVINVGVDGLGIVAEDISILVYPCTNSHVFLLVSDKVLGERPSTGRLHALYHLTGQNTGQVGVRAESFPVSASIRCSA